MTKFEMIEKVYNYCKEAVQCRNCPYEKGCEHYLGGYFIYSEIDEIAEYIENIYYNKGDEQVDKERD